MKYKPLLLTLIFILLLGSVKGELISLDPCGLNTITEQGTGGNADWVYGNQCIQLTMRKNTYDPNVEIQDLVNGRTFKIHLFGVDERDFLGNETSYPFASMGLASDTSQGFLRYNNSDVSIGYIILGNSIKTVATITNLQRTYTTDSDYYLKVNYQKNAEDVVEWIPVIADGTPQPLVLDNRTAGQNFFVYQRMGSSNFNVFEIDPLYSVDYMPIPAELLYTGNVVTFNDTDFPFMDDITSGVSDNLTGTNFGVRKYSGTAQQDMSSGLSFEDTGDVSIIQNSVDTDLNAFVVGDVFEEELGRIGNSFFFNTSGYAQINDSSSKLDLVQYEDMVVCSSFNTSLSDGRHIFQFSDTVNRPFEVQTLWEKIGTGPSAFWMLKLKGTVKRNANHVLVSPEIESQSYNDSQWHTVCLSNNNWNSTLWIDNTSYDSKKGSSPDNEMDDPVDFDFVVFGTEDTYTMDFVGNLDEFCIYKGFDLDVKQLVSDYETLGCTGTQNLSDGQAITGNWNVTYDNTFDWFLRVRKETLGTDTLTAHAYDDNNTISTQSVSRSVDSTGWFNLNVTSLMDYMTNTQLLNFTKLRFFTDESHNFSEVLLRSEINDTQPPTIFNCAVNDTSIGCADTFEVSCNVTDNLDVDQVRFQIDGTNYTGSQFDSHYHYIHDPVDFNGSSTIVWEYTHAEDILNQWNNTFNNVNINYQCDVPAYININHIGNTTVDQFNLTLTSIVLYWNTTNPSDSRVFYGIDPDNKNQSVFDATLVIDHYITLIDLLPDTLYYYDIISSFNPNQTLFNFTFTTPPLDTNITVSAGDTNATVDSTTNLAVNSTIQYDENMTYTFTNTDPVFDFNHSQFLDNLLPNTTYFVNHTFCRQVPPQCFSNLYNFTTLQSPDATPPNFNFLTAFPGIFNATINWSTDEPANFSLNITNSINLSFNSSDFNTSFSLLVLNLTNNTQYTVDLVSCDTSGNCAVTSTMFTTLQTIAGEIDEVANALNNLNLTITSNVNLLITTVIGLLLFVIGIVLLLVGHRASYVLASFLCFILDYLIFNTLNFTLVSWVFLFLAFLAILKALNLRKIETQSAAQYFQDNKS